MAAGETREDRFSRLIREMMSDRKIIYNKDFAALVGVTNGTVGDWLSGQHVPDKIELLESIANLKGWSIDELWRYIKTGEEVAKSTLKESQVQRFLDGSPIETLHAVAVYVLDQIKQKYSEIQARSLMTDPSATQENNGVTDMEAASVYLASKLRDLLNHVFQQEGKSIFNKSDVDKFLKSKRIVRDDSRDKMRRAISDKLENTEIDQDLIGDVSFAIIHFLPEAGDYGDQYSADAIEIYLRKPSDLPPEIQETHTPDKGNKPKLPTN